jgi:hypothetical protein
MTRMDTLIELSRGAFYLCCTAEVIGGIIIIGALVHLFYTQRDNHE